MDTGAESESLSPDQVGRLVQRTDELAREAVRLLGAKGWSVALAESCTAGMVAATLASIPGASAVLNSSAVVYQTRAKSSLLGLDAAFVERFCPVSREVTMALAKAAREKNGADAGCAVTGWAGPSGGPGPDPVGTCYMAIDVDGHALCLRRVFAGGRDLVRKAATATALEMICNLCRK